MLTNVSFVWWFLFNVSISETGNLISSKHLFTSGLVVKLIFDRLIKPVQIQTCARCTTKPSNTETMMVTNRPGGRVKWFCPVSLAKVNHLVGTYIRWLLRTCCAPIKENRSFLICDCFRSYVLNRSNNIGCSWCAHLFLSYHLI